jgi:hypothetical protein
LSLYATIRLPEPDESAYRPDHLFAFIHLIKLYALLDDRFFSLWNHTATDDGVPPDWLDGLQRNFTNAVPGYLDQTNPAALELLMSQQWLRTMVWRQSMLQGGDTSSLVSNSSIFGSKFILDVCQELIEQLGHFSNQAFEAHGLDLAEKLFDITCCLVDCISALPFQVAFEARQRLQRLVATMSSLSSAQSRLVPLLSTKLSSQPELASDPAFPSASIEQHARSIPMMGTDATALGLHMMGLQQVSSHQMDVLQRGNMEVGQSSNSAFIQGMMDGMRSHTGQYVAASREMQSRSQPPTSGAPGYPSYRYMP